MANRYWVGGTASWDGTAGSKWATTDGGAGGSAIPTSADDVFVTAKNAPTWVGSTAYILTNIVSPVTGNGYFYECTTAGTTGSTEPTWPTVVGNTVTDGTVVWTCRLSTLTIASGNTGAKSMDFTGYIGTLTGVATGSFITISGSVTLSSGMSCTYDGRFTFNATATLTSAGKTLSRIIVSGASTTLTLGDALTTNQSLETQTGGTFNTANYNLTVAVLSLSGGPMNLGSSTVTVTNSGNAILFSTPAFDAGTSQINITSATGAISATGKTFYNVSFTSTAIGTRVITGSNTFNNLTLGSSSSSGLVQLSITANQTVNGTFTCSGGSAIARNFVRSDTLGTARTITAATLTATDCDFRDITIAGGAAGTTPTRAGDCGGNSGITFSSKTVYRVGTNTTWEGSSSWALTSGSTGSNDNFPLAQDTAIINNDTTLTGTLTVDNVVYNFSTIDCSSRTTAITIRMVSAGSFYGSFKLSSATATSGAGSCSFVGRGTMTINCAGQSFPGSINLISVGGTLNLGDAFTTGTNAGITITQGTFDAVSYNVTTTVFVSNGSTTRTVTMGSGTWTLTSTGGVWNTGTTTNLTFNKDTANIVLSNTTTTARTFSGGGLTYNKLTIGGATGTSTTTFTGSNTFSELASTKTVAHTLSFTAGTTTTVGAWTITGTSGNVVTIQSATAASHTLTKTGGGTVSTDYMSISRSTATPATTWYAGTNSTNGGNNSGWIFTAPPSTATGNMFMLFQ